MKTNLTPRTFYDSFRYQAAALAALSLFVFGASIGFTYVLDDHDLFTKIGLLSGPLAIFGAGDIFQTYYRPLFILSLAVEHSLTPAPWLPHLVNVLLHIVVSILALAVARRLLPNSPWAFVAALAFAIHPTRAENVAWISGRTDLLATGGMLLAMLLLWRARQRRSIGLSLLSAFSAILAMFAKETALLSPVFLLAGWWARPKSSPARVPTRTQTSGRGILGVNLAVQGAGIVLLLSLRNAAGSGLPMEPLFPAFGGTVLNAARNFALYVWHTFTGGGEEYLVRGWRMVRESGFNFMPLPADALHLIGISAILLIFLGWALWAVLSIRHSDPSRRRGFRVVLIALILFGAFLFPTLGFIPIQYNYSTRFLYLPLLFFVTALGGTVGLLFGGEGKGQATRRRISSEMALAGLVVLLLGTVETFRATLRWRDDVTLFSWMTARCPEAPVAFSCLGNGYRHRAESRREAPKATSDWLSAAKYSQQARRLWPRYRDAYLTEAGALRMAAQANPERADSCLRAAIEAYAAGAQALSEEPLLPMYAGDTFLNSGNLAAAEEAYQDALRRSPGNPEVQERLAVLSRMKANALNIPSKLGAGPRLSGVPMPVER
jgi:hypothetical protein